LNITNELREKLLTADSAEKVAELLKADGQEVEPDDVEKLWAEVTKKRQKDDRKLSVDELDAVSGGAFWLGEDAPDGHELGCWNIWYEDWSEFNLKHMDEYCWGQQGRKHEFGGVETIKYGDELRPARVCKLCHHWVYLDLKQN
jgi:hypothetical protein